MSTSRVFPRHQPFLAHLSLSLFPLLAAHTAAKTRPNPVFTVHPDSCLEDAQPQLRVTPLQLSSDGTHNIFEFGATIQITLEQLRYCAHTTLVLLARPNVLDEAVTRVFSRGRICGSS